MCMTALRTGSGDIKAEMRSRAEVARSAMQSDPKSFMSGLIGARKSGNDLSHLEAATGGGDGRVPITLGNSNPNKKQTLGGI